MATDLDRLRGLTETSWPLCDDPRLMLHFILYGNLARATGGGGLPYSSPPGYAHCPTAVSDRKLRLWACALWRRWHAWQYSHHSGSHDAEHLAAMERAVVAAESLADGAVQSNPAATARWMCLLPEAYQSADQTLLELGSEMEGRAMASMLRDIVGNPWRPGGPLPPSWRHEGDVLRLARHVYADSRHPRDGTLDGAGLAVLSDALEDAGYADEQVLGHLRSPGPHVLGCWALDLILAKE